MRKNFKVILLSIKVQIYPAIMTKSIPAIFEDGIFKPLQKVNLPEHKHVHILVIPEEEVELLQSQQKALSGIIGKGSSGLTNVASEHDRYLY